MAFECSSIEGDDLMLMIIVLGMQSNVALFGKYVLTMALAVLLP